MPIDIDGVAYFSANEVAALSRVSRQTFWRWRREGRVPRGRLFRDRQLLFTRSELEQAQEYANRVEPLDPISREQLKLFNGVTSGSER
jgi:predicted DNA-binding transcriptional regulator AlpA